jgi:glycosyltransferase involved in cell wall biosynthesis
MTGATISCVVPVFNGERYLAEALDSVLRQTRPPDEIVVVDDGSSDRSAEIVRGYGNRVRYVRQDNRGAAAARNRGVELAGGELLAFIDQDDLWRPHKLELQLASFAADPGLDICVSHVDLQWDSARAEEQAALGEHRRARRVPGYTTPAMLARRSAFARIGPLDTRLTRADATDWFLRGIDLGLSILLIPQALLVHRMHDTNLSRHRESGKREFVRLVKATLDRRRRLAVGSGYRSGGDR